MKIKSDSSGILRPAYLRASNPALDGRWDGHVLTSTVSYTDLKHSVSLENMMALSISTFIPLSLNIMTGFPSAFVHLWTKSQLFVM
jgi:hypothetical protein